MLWKLGCEGVLGFQMHGICNCWLTWCGILWKSSNVAYDNFTHIEESWRWRNQLIKTGFIQANISTSVQRCFSCRDVAQRQIDVEKTLCTSTLKYSMFNNVETKLRISTLNGTTLDNVEKILQIWPFEQKNKENNKENIFELQEYARLKIFFNFSSF